MTARITRALLLAGSLAGCLKAPAPSSPATEPRPSASAPNSTDQLRSYPVSRLFARCVMGYCDFDLAIPFAYLGAPAELLIDPCNRTRENCATHVGRLTLEGRKAAAALRDQLAATALQRRYGCPGCGDGPVYGFVVPKPSAAESTTHHRYNPLAMSEVPETLRSAHEFFERVRLAVANCEPNEWIELQGSCDTQPQGRASALR